MPFLGSSWDEQPLPAIEKSWTLEEVTAHHKTRALHTIVVDVVVWRPFCNGIEVLLIKRKYEPFAGSWALPGGFVEVGETCARAARRELEEETGLVALGPGLSLVGVFDALGRDPRGPNIGIAYVIKYRPIMGDPRAADVATEFGWFSVNSLPQTAFDHANIIALATTEIES